MTLSKDPLFHANQILRIVAEQLGITQADMISSSRTMKMVDARHIYAIISQRYCPVKITSTLAGTVIKKRHATILHSVKTATDLTQTYKPFSAKLNRCLAAYTNFLNMAEYNNIPQL